PQPPGDPVKLKGKEIEGADYRKERRTLRRSGNTHYSGDTLFNGNDCTGKTKTETYAHYYRAEECVDHVKYICLHHEHKEFTYSNDGSVLCGFKDYSLTDCFVGGEC
ncbi:MAG: hypothetical protein KDD44_13355, partial [Bdellovibrionales bacterium]|nr:hypothetical protein [Bdellovibrionales bacterium]